jgi:proline iminopeptidase
VGRTLGASVAAAAAAATVGTLAVFRASSAERLRAMPGDDVVPDAMHVTTQAVTIHAPPASVWPWLAQMGAGRGGWYSYDRIDNGGRPSARSILPEYQHVAPGDIMPALRGATDAFVVAAVDEQRDLVLTVNGDSGRSLMSWEFNLVPVGRGRTRLIVRSRVSSRWAEEARREPATAGAPAFIERFYALLARLPAPLRLAAGGFGHRVMQNQQLRGIRRRAESLAAR